MTEDQIERRVERMTDQLDAEFMAGKITQAEYDYGHSQIAQWVADQYDLLARRS